MSSRKEEKERLRQERMAREQAAAAAAQRKKLVGYGAAAVLALAAVAAIVVVALSGGGEGDASTPDQTADSDIQVEYAEDPPPIPDAKEFNLRKAAAAGDCRLVDPANEGSTHVTTDVSYKANPPTSGNHDPIPTGDGAYTEPPRLENSVHTLEHGRIEIQFQATLPQARIDQLKALFDEDSYHVLLFPNATRMRPQVAVTAWDHALHCGKMNDQAFDAIRAFKDKYRDQGPEFVP